MSAGPTAKVLFRVPDDEGGANVETLWATPLGQDRYVLDNSPFYAYAVSWQDTIYAPYDADEQMAAFLSVVSKSGNRTVRVIFDPPVAPGNESDANLQGLIALGTSYEGATRKYISVNIPPEASLESVCSYLTARNIQWEHADPTYASLYPDEA